MEKANISIDKAYKLVNPGAVLLVSVGDGESDNLFSVTWNMPVRKTPGMVALLSGKRHYSWPYIARTGELGLNVPDASLADAVFGCGTTTGHDGVEKWDRFGLTRLPAEQIKAPLVDDAVANLECRVSQVVDLGASALLVAQIVAARASTRHCPGGDWDFDSGLELLHHCTGNRFVASGRAIRAGRS